MDQQEKPVQKEQSVKEEKPKREWKPAQKDAIEIRGTTVLVSAAAGSGKTSVLTERLIRLLTDPNHPMDLSRLLIVTFTRAATADLKHKIAKALSEKLAKNPGDGNVSKQILKLGSAQISTIDSFFQKVVHDNFDRLDIPAAFRIVEEKETLPIANEVLDEVLEDFYRKYEKKSQTDSLFSRVIDNPFATAIDHLTSAKSDGKLNQTLLAIYKRFSSYPEGIELLKQNADTLDQEAKCDFIKTRAGQFLYEEAKTRFGSALTFLKQADIDIRREPDFYKSLSPMLQSDTAYCESVLEAVRTQRYSELFAVAPTFAVLKFTPKSNKPDSVLAYQAMRETLKKSVDFLKAHTIKTDAQIAEELKQTADFSRMLYEFLHEFESRFLQEKVSRGVMEFTDIRKKLYRLLVDENGNPTDVARHLADQYDAVYIDEYQDIDPLQDAVFGAVSKDNRFMVGDIKQSIYGFRGSEPSIFSGYRKAMPPYHKGMPLPPAGVCVFMSDNFRCDEPVVELTNRVCSFLFSACPSSIHYLQEDDLRFAKEPPETNKDYVPQPTEFCVFEDDKDEDGNKLDNEAVWIGRRIKEMLTDGKKDDGSPILPCDIAILVHNRKHSEGIRAELNRLHIPVTDDFSKSAAEPLMIDLLNLLRTVDNPYRDLSLSELLVSPFWGWSLSDVAAIRAASPLTKSLYDAIVFASTDETNSARKKASEFVSWIDKEREIASVQSVDRFLRQLYSDEHVAPYRDHSVLLSLYDLARNFAKTSYVSLYGFLKTVNQLEENDKLPADHFKNAENAVTFLTIHHSKGLEFPIVFLPGCGHDFNMKSSRTDYPYHRNIGFASVLFDENSGSRKPTALYNLCNAAIADDLLEEEIRVLYVGMTRAKERLLISGTVSKIDNLDQKTKSIMRGDRASILAANNYLAWIYAALQRTSSTRPDLETDVHFFQKGSQQGDLVPASPFDSKQASKVQQASPETERYAEVYKKAQDYEYILADLRGLPTKAAASKLQKDLVDRLTIEEEDDSAESLIALMEGKAPSFDLLLQQGKTPTASEIGTATHAFLQYCDFARLAKDGVEKERARLVGEGYLSPSDAKILNLYHLGLFVKSDLMKLILKATDVRREQTFQLYIPFSELTSNDRKKAALEGHELFVQGSIDLLLTMPDGRFLLVDYKTDRIPEEERNDPSLAKAHLKAAHEMQLEMYARAVKGLFDKDPDAVLIYSLPLGRSFDLSEP